MQKQVSQSSPAPRAAARRRALRRRPYVRARWCTWGRPNADPRSFGRRTRASRRCAVTGRLDIVALFILAATARAALSQQPASVAPAVAPYRPTALVLVQPAPGSSIPQDRPTLVFRFAPGDSSDPIDTRSFAISVDGVVRSALFRITSDEAFGALGPVSGDSSVALGAHQFAARICTVRGACAEASGLVNVVASAAAPPASAPNNRRRTILDVIVAVAKKLLIP